MLKRATVATVMGLLLMAAAGASPAAADVTLLRVDCASAHACMAVGTTSSAGGSHARAESWNGQAWRRSSVTLPRAERASNFFDVSCISARSCVAVGGYQTSVNDNRRLALVERWNGSRWTIMPAPHAPVGGGDLSAVACSSIRACVATGSAIRAGHNNTWGAAWNGRRWERARVPLPSGATYSLTGGLSCVSRSLCVAAGQYEAHDTAKSRTLTETWNGRAWHIVPSPDPASGANGATLDDVSCVSARFCVAVGGASYPSNYGGRALAETWDGRTWSISQSPVAPEPAGSHLGSVSCASPTACVAIGSDFTSAAGAEDVHARAQVFDGAHWTVSPVADGPGAMLTDLNSVSCGAAGACVTVGGFFVDPRGLDAPIAEAFDGSGWRITPSL